MSDIPNAMKLDWSAATAAAKRILDLCNESSFTAPENVDGHHRQVVRVCEQLELLVTALRISKR